MKKEYVSYGLIGIVAGLVLGFIVGNWATASGVAAPQAMSRSRLQSTAAIAGRRFHRDIPQSIPVKPFPRLRCPRAQPVRRTQLPPPRLLRQGRRRSFLRSIRYPQAAKKSAPNRNTRTFNCSKGFRQTGLRRSCSRSKRRSVLNARTAT